LNPVLANLYARRSIRAFADTPLPPYQLREILTAGQYAPSGRNRQACHFLCIHTPEILTQLKTLSCRVLSDMEITPDTNPSLVHSIEQAKKGTCNFTYGAPVLVLVANRQNYNNALADSACAIENIMLAATSFGIGSGYINQIRWLRDEPLIRQMLLSFGMKEDETIYGGVSLGYAAQSPAAPLARTGNLITML